MRRLKVYIKNIAKIALIALAYVTPRIKNKWVFGSNMGYSNNSKYFFLFILNSRPEIKAIWITHSGEVYKLLKARNIKVYKAFSISGLYHSYTAKYFCYNSYASDINVFASFGATRVNLWHGIGIKKIEFKIDKGPLADRFKNQNLSNKLNYINHFVKPHLFLSTSPFMSKHFSECFQLNESSIIESIYPRCEILNWSIARLTLFIELNEPKSTLNMIKLLHQFQDVIIYMPTWRDTQEDFINLSGFDFYKLNEYMKEINSCFILKLHPATKLDLSSIKCFSNIIYLDNEVDVYPILPFTSILITDYSSIYYDYLLMSDKSSIIFAFDFHKYTLNSRDFIIPFLSAVGENVVYNFSDLLVLLKKKQYKTNNSEINLIKTFWGDSVRSSNDNLLNSILSANV